VTQTQLRTVGVSWATEAAHIDAHRWHSRPPVVVVMHNGPLTTRQRWWVAMLNAGPAAALCARTALEADGLTGWPAAAVEILVVKGTLVRPAAGVRVHESRRFDPRNDVHPARTPPRTRPARSAVDAAAWTPNPRTAVGLLAAVVQQRLARPDELVRELERAGRVRWHNVMARAVCDIGGGAQALSEIDFVRLCRRHGLPEPVKQAVRVQRSGRRRYLDAEWVRPDGQRVVAEVDGAVHLLPRGYWDDMDRQNELAIDGSTVLRFPAFVLRSEPRRVAAQLARALGVSV